MSPSTGRGLSYGITAFLALLAAAALAALVYQLVVVRPDHAAAEAERRDRVDAVRVAEQFAVEVNNYDVAGIEGYQESVSRLLTTKFATDFEQAMRDIVVSVREAEMTSQGEVLTSAVAGIDADSAEVLVVADATVKTVYDTRARHFRWEVSLVKVDGNWLVDNFTPVL